MARATSATITLAYRVISCIYIFVCSKAIRTRQFIASHPILHPRLQGMWLGDPSTNDGPLQGSHYFQGLNKMSAQAPPRDGGIASSSVSGTSASSDSGASNAGNTSAKQQQQLVQLTQVPSDGQRHRTLSSPLCLYFEPCTPDTSWKKNFACTV